MPNHTLTTWLVATPSDVSTVPTWMKYVLTEIIERNTWILVSTRKKKVKEIVFINFAFPLMVFLFWSRFLLLFHSWKSTTIQNNLSTFVISFITSFRFFSSSNVFLNVWECPYNLRLLSKICDIDILIWDYIMNMCMYDFWKIFMS